MRTRTLSALCFAMVCAAASAETLRQKVDPWVLDTAARGDTEFLVILREQADLRGASALATRTEKSRFVADALSATAAQIAGSPPRAASTRAGRRAPLLLGRQHDLGPGRPRPRRAISRRATTSSTSTPIPRVRFAASFAPPGSAEPPDARTRSSGTSRRSTRPDVWALGYTGQGVVVAGAGHRLPVGPPRAQAAISRLERRRADHNYNWHDAIHSGGGSLRARRLAGALRRHRPRHAHDGHDGGRRRRRQPDRRGARARSGSAAATWTRATARRRPTPSASSGSSRPTDLERPEPRSLQGARTSSTTPGAARRARAARTRHVLQTVVENTRAAGIEVVVSAGNGGSGCSTVDRPAGDLRRVLLRRRDRHRRRHRGLLQPRPGDGRRQQPPEARRLGARRQRALERARQRLRDLQRHEHGGTARRRRRRRFVLSAKPPTSIGDPGRDRAALTATAVAATTSQTAAACRADQIPNNTYGWGRVDALAAVTADALARRRRTRPIRRSSSVPSRTRSPSPTSDPGTAPDVTVSEGLTLGRDGRFGHAQPGRLHAWLAHGASCDLGADATRRERPRSRSSARRRPCGTLTATGLVTAHGGRSRTPDNDSGQRPDRGRDCPFPAPAISAPSRCRRRRRGLTAAIDVGSGPRRHLDADGGTLTGGRARARSPSPRAIPARRCSSRLVDSLGAAPRPRRASSSRSTSSTCRRAHPFHDFVNTVSRHGITAGCGGGPSAPTPRHARADGRLPAQGRARRGLRASAGDRHGLRRRAPSAPSPPTGSRSSPRSASPAAAATATTAPALRSRGADGGLPPEDADRLRLRPPAATRIFGDVPCPGRLRRTGSRTSTPTAVTGGCRRIRCSTVPTTQHARPDGGVHHEDFRTPVGQSFRWPDSSNRRDQRRLRLRHGVPCCRGPAFGGPIGGRLITKTFALP